MIWLLLIIAILWVVVLAIWAFSLALMLCLLILRVVWFAITLPFRLCVSGAR